MRTTKDRIRHAALFELSGFVIVVTLGGWVFDLALKDIGLIAVVSTTLATIWTYIYNLLFDRVMHARLGHTQKTPLMRVGHSLLFEAGLLLILVPFIAWYLAIGLVEAFVMDIAISLFYLFYSFAYNWAYDIVFPDVQDCRA